jgi:hypothetical protein
MKTTQQIATDCGIEEFWIKEALTWPAYPESTPNETNLAATAAALYRRIEKLELFTGELVEQMRPSIDDLQRTNKQNALNATWMIEMMDRIHSALCPTMNGTWQQRAEQAVAEAEVIGAEKDERARRITSEEPR